jgi:large subunit ribosomal protein L1
MKKSKRAKQNTSLVEFGKDYTLNEAVDLIKKTANAKFDESVEIAVNLGVDPRQADQVVRGTVSLPHGIGKVVRVLVLAKGDKEKEAKDNDADFVGFEEYIKKIQEGWLDFDVIIATPDVMADVGKLGKILGPRGLMPNPKSGTVTFDVGKAVKEVKAGKIEFRVDKNGIIHVAVGKASFDAQKIRENLLAFMDTVVRLKPASSKGHYLKKVTVSNTMGPGIQVERSTLLSEVR